jgi:hypothetical protein
MNLKKLKEKINNHLSALMEDDFGVDLSWEVL